MTMCPVLFVCVPQELYCLVLLGLSVCIAIIAGILSPPMDDPMGDEEQKAKKRKMTPERKRPPDIDEFACGCNQDYYNCGGRYNSFIK